MFIVMFCFKSNNVSRLRFGSRVRGIVNIILVCCVYERSSLNTTSKVRVCVFSGERHGIQITLEVWLCFHSTHTHTHTLLSVLDHCMSLIIAKQACSLIKVQTTGLYTSLSRLGRRLIIQVLCKKSWYQTFSRTIQEWCHVRCRGFEFSINLIFL